MTNALLQLDDTFTIYGKNVSNTLIHMYLIIGKTWSFLLWLYSNSFVDNIVFSESLCNKQSPLNPSLWQKIHSLLSELHVCQLTQVHSPVHLQGFLREPFVATLTSFRQAEHFSHSCEIFRIHNATWAVIFRSRTLNKSEVQLHHFFVVSSWITNDDPLLYWRLETITFALLVITVAQNILVRIRQNFLLF